MTGSLQDLREKSLKDQELWYNDFAVKLLNENFLLTALEFHSELVETGRELPKLKEFFSNPGNFEQQLSSKPEILSTVSIPRSSSQATLDSLDLTRYSEDGERGNDERVAVLEFELRKARETITALRTNLTYAAEAESKQEKLEDNVKNVPRQSPSIRPHEQRALNFLINEYLLLHGYKLTSITFADENESQDFEDWDDVGLNVPRPLELLPLYREGLKGSGHSALVETKHFECQVTLLDEIQFNVQLREMASEIADLQEKITLLEMEKLQVSKQLLEHEAIESRTSGSPDQDCFEMIDNIKSREGSETKSELSNSDWTKVRKDSKSDIHSNYEEADKISEEQLKLADSFNEMASEELQQDYSGLVQCPVAEEYRENQEITPSFMPVARPMPEGFKMEIVASCETSIPCCSGELWVWLEQNPLSELTSEQLILHLSTSLPNIIPYIILNKREFDHVSQSRCNLDLLTLKHRRSLHIVTTVYKILNNSSLAYLSQMLSYLTPRPQSQEAMTLLVVAVCLNPNGESRDKLLNLLFNIKKRPQREERAVILQALLLIAQYLGPAGVEAEVLPQCWEQITHKYVERRILVAESCFVLAPYLSESIRNSLVVSMVQQLLQDREESIRHACVDTLALLIALSTDEDKYLALLELCLQLLHDDSTAVTDAAHKVLFPTLAQWSFTTRRLHQDLFPKLLAKLKKDKRGSVVSVIQSLLPYLVMTVADSDYLKGVSTTGQTLAAKRVDFSHLCRGLCDPMLFFGRPVGPAMAVFDQCTSSPEFDTRQWPELEWVLEFFIPDLMASAQLVVDNQPLLMSIIMTLRYLCAGLGKNITNFKIKATLSQQLAECENALVAGEECQLSLIPVYLVGILSTDPEAVQEMSNVLRRFICALPLCGSPLGTLQVTVDALGRQKVWQILVLDALWEGVVHLRPLVRSAAATLLQSVIPHLSEPLLASKVAPALVTLSSDPELSVRTCSIPTLGMLAGVKAKDIKDKVYLTIQSLLMDPTTLENYAMTVELVSSVKDMYEASDRSFREDVIVPRLAAVAALCSQNKSPDLVRALTEAFSAISASHNQLSSHTITTALLPGLRYLETACVQLKSPYMEHIETMIKEAERQTAGAAEALVTSPTSDSRRLMSNTGGIVVEDVKNRVTKIFNSRPNTLHNVSGIFKKKT